MPVGVSAQLREEPIEREGVGEGKIKRKRLNPLTDGAHMPGVVLVMKFWYSVVKGDKKTNATNNKISLYMICKRKWSFGNLLETLWDFKCHACNIK